MFTTWSGGIADSLAITLGQAPSWSPQGPIAYHGCDPSGGECGVWAMDPNGGAQARLSSHNSDTAPDWSPDGGRIAFMSARNGNWDIYTINGDGSQSNRLTTDGGNNGLPTWSPNGEWIAFQSTRPGFTPDASFEQGPNQGGQSPEDNWGIWIMRSDGTDLRQVFAFDGLDLEGSVLADVPHFDDAARFVKPIPLDTLDLESTRRILRQRVHPRVELARDLAERRADTALMVGTSRAGHHSGPRGRSSSAAEPGEFPSTRRRGCRQ